MYAAETAALDEPLVPEDVYTLLDGPRVESDELDHTRFWLDRWGAPKKIRDARGNETTLFRTDARFPALVTRVESPPIPSGQRVQTASYTASGNPETITEVEPYGPGSEDAITTYAWDARWDFVTRIILPEGEVTQFAYDPDNGNRLWQQVGSDPARRVEFGYDPGTGLLDEIDTPLRPLETIEYDPLLGNLAAHQTPLGFRTSYQTDAIGRDTLITSPINVGSAQSAKRRVEYDVMDREVLVQSIGPAITQTVGSLSWTTPAETLSVRTVYNPEGAADSVLRWSVPDPNAIGTLTTQWEYDAAGRAVVEIPAGSGWRTETIEELVCEDETPASCQTVTRDTTYFEGVKDSTVYDPAGNPVEVHTRRGHTLTMQYDALGRLKERHVPEVTYPGFTDLFHFPLFNEDGQAGLTIAADVETFTYDAMGNVRTANNGDARVSREHYPNGLLETETQRIRTYAGADFDQHVYTLDYTYDRNGRRTVLQHPEALAPRSNGIAQMTQQYTYDEVTGQLDTVADVFGNRFKYLYDLEGRLNHLTVPGGISTQWTYDGDGRRQRRIQTASLAVVEQPDGSLGTLMHDDVFTYDAHDKVLEVQTRGGFSTNGYTELGNLAASYNEDTALPSRYESDERYTTDAFAHQRGMFRSWSSGQLPKVDTATYHYEAGTGRLVSAEGNPDLIETAYADFMRYDGAGNKEYHGRSANSFQERSRFYYAADQQLRVVDRRTCVWDGTQCTTATPSAGSISTFEEHRYDALGRRVLSRTRQEAVCYNNTCDKSIRRFVWDGDRLLYEMRYPGKTGTGAALMEQDTGLVIVKDTLPLVGEVTVPPLFGRVAYTHGADLDHPLGIIRMNYSAALPEPVAFFPHTNWRAEFDSGSFPDGTLHHCADPDDDPYDTQRCLRVFWPAPFVNMFYHSVRDNTPPTWHGSLVDGQRDASGQMYRRNRYYDPTTARFTQEDPIGLAGGLNLYGYANGDPVNFSDPFGLRSCPPMCGPVPMPGPGALPIPMPTPQMMEDLGAALQTVADAASGALDAVRDKAQIKFVTYTRANSATGQVYSGRTSGFGDPQSIVNARAGSHPGRLGGFGPAVVDRWGVGAQGYAAIRGREQQLIDVHGGAQSEGGTSANLIRGVSRRNPLAGIYDAAATGMFGPIP